MITETDFQQLRSRVNELEDRLKFLYRRLGVDYTADPNADPIMLPEIQAALRRGNKIEAIKLYRELTGLGLTEAKSVIDKAEQFPR